MSDLNTEFSLGNNIGAYYRGAGGWIADIPENGAVPTLGNPISYSNLRQTVKKITANANGNWQHLQQSGRYMRVHMLLLLKKY